MDSNLVNSNLELKLSPNENMDATHSTIPFQVIINSSNENQTSQISSHETIMEFDFFKDNNNDHYEVVSTSVNDNVLIHTDTPSLLELKLSVSDHNSIVHYSFFYLLYYITLFLNFIAFEFIIANNHLFYMIMLLI